MPENRKNKGEMKRPSLYNWGRSTQPDYRRGYYRNWLGSAVRLYGPKEPLMGIFGVVLYTDRHPNIRKVLRDPDYWEALNEISGPVLQLFSIRTAQGTWESGVPWGASGMLHGFWLEPQANLPLLKLFELDSTRGLPVLVVFTWDSEDVVEKVVIPLADHDPVTSFSRLREVVEVASRAVESVGKDGASGQDYIAMIRSEFASFGRTDRIKKGYEVLKEIRDWLPF